MATSERWKPSVTVAAVIEKDGRFLLVEEHTAYGLQLNNPAGHLEPHESPEQGCVREVLEEAAYQFTPTALVGVYLTSTPDTTYLRFAYCGTLGAHEAHRLLDTGIVRTLWMTPEEVRGSAHRHRSPVVVRCMEDYLSGQRHPLNLVHTELGVAMSPILL
jgi:8-oxo-dGTP pyrophosphatase MutT (NUDIX family)